MVRFNEETGQTVMSGMGELHLEVLVDRMRREFNVEAQVGRPRVSYRETVTRPYRSEAQLSCARRADMANTATWCWSWSRWTAARGHPVR